jgi:hypothetical protein
MTTRRIGSRSGRVGHFEGGEVRREAGRGCALPIASMPTGDRGSSNRSHLIGAEK